MDYIFSKYRRGHEVNMQGFSISFQSTVYMHVFIRLPSLRKLARPVYIKKGIIIEVAKGIQTASELG